MSTRLRRRHDGDTPTARYGQAESANSRGPSTSSWDGRAGLDSAHAITVLSGRVRRPNSIRTAASTPSARARHSRASSAATR